MTVTDATTTATALADAAITKANEKKKSMTWIFIINAFILAIGNCGGPLVMRLYFLHGGNRIWLSSWLETGGWPIIFIPLLVSYHQRRRKYGPSAAKLYFMNSTVFYATTAIGVLTGFDDYLYAYGMSRLPVSTASLIIASQLVFTAGFAYVLVKQKFTAYTINSVVLLTVAAVVLGVHSSGDRPEGETDKKYFIGFGMTVGAALLYGLILPLVELTYKKAKQVVTYTLVLEIQLVMCFFATLVCTVGMAINNDFKVIPREARAFDLGERMYYVVVVFSGIIWQCFYLGVIGVIFSGSSLLSAIVIAVLLPITEILSVIFFKEQFKVDKGISLVLSLWGFASYFYGEAKLEKKNQAKEIEERNGEAEVAACIP